MNLEKVLNLINLQIGTELKLCEDFPGIRHQSGKKYFNVILSQRLSESTDYSRLERFAKKYGFIHLQPNGVKRLAIFFNSELLTRINNLD